MKEEVLKQIDRELEVLYSNLYSYQTTGATKEELASLERKILATKNERKTWSQK
jgi:hypothetical protein